MPGEFDEIYQLARDLGDAADASDLIRKAVQVTSNNIKKQSQESVRMRRQIGHAAQAITYDTVESSSGVDAEIGYDKDRPAGALGNIVEFGNPRFSPSYDLGNALLNNEDDFEYGLGRAVDDASKRRNL